MTLKSPQWLWLGVFCLIVSGIGYVDWMFIFHEWRKVEAETLAEIQAEVAEEARQAKVGL